MRFTAVAQKNRLVVTSGGAVRHTIKHSKQKTMKYLLGIFASLIILSAQAQEGSQETAPADSSHMEITPGSGDTTIVRLGNHQLKIVERDGKDEILLEKKAKEGWETTKKHTLGEDGEKSDWHKKTALTHWSGVYFGINGFVGDNMALDLPEASNALQLDYGKSFTFSLNFPEVKFRLIKDYVGFYTGLGYQFHSYRLRRNTDITFGNEMTFAPDTVRNLTRNTIQAGYLRVPFMLEFNTSKKPMKTFHVAAGVVGGMRIHSTYVQDHNASGVDYTTQVKGIPNLNLFSAEAMLRVGYGPLVFYASYWLTPLFERSSAPELYPINAGVGFAF